MPFLSYALTAACPDVGGVVGVTGAPVRALAVADGLAVGAGTAPAPPVCARPETGVLVAYAEAVAALFARQTVVPLRFGAVAPSAEAARASVAEAADAHRAALARLDGRAEMSLRGPLPPPAGAAPDAAAGAAPAAGAATTAAAASGAAYLRRRKQARAAAAEAARRARAAAVRRYLTGPPAESVADAAWGVRGATWTLAVLLPRAEADAFRAHAEAAATAGVTVTGPWPPYSFV